jgi:Na+/H+ antiporter NhaD/arsenite permease-like protein
MTGEGWRLQTGWGWVEWALLFETGFRMLMIRFGLATVLFGLAARPAAAASFDGAALGAIWAVPFAGILLSIALGPLLFPAIWHRFYGAIAALWALCCLIPMALSAGLETSLHLVLHTFLLEYLPFITMLFALFSAAGGIVVGGNLSATPFLNTGLLALGAASASLIGTTGASMILIRPLIRANDGRRHRVHVVVFFIFLVSNIGGSLTPLGDPPLFLGFLRGVDFFWTLKELWQETLFAVLVLLGAFFLLDSYFVRHEQAGAPVPDPTPASSIHLRGLANVPLILCAIAAIILSGVWTPGPPVLVFGIEWPVENIVREAIMLAVGLLSILITPSEHRRSNDFDWEPIIEVAKLFAAIFICIIPVMAMLQAGPQGVFAPVAALVKDGTGQPVPLALFWMTGSLSAVLDNAPTYLVFFELAGGDAQQLMGPLAPALAAISLGAVFMGAMTYIGNAPNFMVYAIARTAGVPMPSFFGYLMWSGAILLPLFGLVSLLFMR